MTDTSTSTPSPADGYLEWAQESLGVVVHHPLTISPAPGMAERGVYCEEDIPAEAIVVSVPWEVGDISTKSCETFEISANSDQSFCGCCDVISRRAAFPTHSRQQSAVSSQQSAISTAVSSNVAPCVSCIPAAVDCCRCPTETKHAAAGYTTRSTRMHPGLAALRIFFPSGRRLHTSIPGSSRKQKYHRGNTGGNQDQI